MNIASMLRDVTESLLKRPVTQKYPFERLPAPERLRGQLQWNSAKCTGCALCVKDCPADAIELVVNDKKAKVFVMRYNADRCIYCAQCVSNCRFDCLEMSNEEWELAALSKESYLMYWGKEEAVKAYLASLNAPAEPTPAPVGADLSVGPPAVGPDATVGQTGPTLPNAPAPAAATGDNAG